MTIITDERRAQQRAQTGEVPQPHWASATATFDGTRLGAALAAVRAHHNLTLAEVSERSGLNESVISRIEHGVIASPRFEVVSKLAFTYGVSLDEVAAAVGLPRLTVSYVPPLNLEISDARIRSALLTLAQETDPAWVEHAIRLISMATSSPPHRS